MALDFKKGRSGALSAIAEKQNTSQSIINIPASKIVENEMNSQIFNMDDIEILAEEIRENGFHGAIEVVRQSNGNYEIISGHRRFRALQINGVQEIPCIILDIPADDEEKKLSILITANTFNREISPLSMARAIDAAEKNIFSKKKGNTRKALSDFFKVSESQIHRFKSLLRLIPEFQDLVETKQVPYAYLSEVAVKEEDFQKEVYERIMENVSDEKPLEISKSEIKKIINKLEEPEADEEVNVQSEELEVIEETDIKPEEKIETESEIDEYDEELDYEEEREETEADEEINVQSEKLEIDSQSENFEIKEDFDVQSESEPEEFEETDDESEDYEVDEEDEEENYKAKILKSIDKYRTHIQNMCDIRDIKSNLRNMLIELESVMDELDELS